MFFRKRKERGGKLQGESRSGASPRVDDAPPHRQVIVSPTATVCRVYGQLEGLGVSPAQLSASANTTFSKNCMQGMKVLLAEDHEANAYLLIEWLEHLGAEVVHALDGEAACTLATSGSGFDVVLMDCQMPNVDGFEATRRIRSWEAAHGRRGVPIIALTGLSQEFEREHSMQAGMTNYLVKPYSDFQIAAAIQAVVRSWTHAGATVGW
jgi:CheY-like chemotaxis protein